jgi:hypothetical protein
MPLNGRNASDLAYLTGGVIPMGEGADGQFAVNGARADNVSLMLDGMNNTQRRNTGPMVSPPLEGIQEFKMITSGFSAEYGRFAGGVLSLISKSGQPLPRLAVRVPAMILCAQLLDAAKSNCAQNQYGATVSGPVTLPLYRGHDQRFHLRGTLHFRAATQRCRAVLGHARGDPQPSMPSANRQNYRPASQDPFPDNQIPLSRPIR